MKVIKLSKRKLLRQKKKLLKALRATDGWPFWVAMCCGWSCSDPPDANDRSLLEELETVCFLLGEDWREVIRGEA